MCCRPDFNSGWARLRCCLSKNPLKWNFLDIYLATYLGVRNFQNIWAMTVILFFENIQISRRFRKRSKKIRKISRFWDTCIWIACVKMFPIYMGYESHLFFENIQNLMKISKIQQKYWKMLNFFEIIASELVVLKCLY